MIEDIRRIARPVATTCLLVAVAACGKKGAGGSAAKVTQADVDAVNAAIPADLKDKVTFELGKVEDKRGRHSTTYTLAVPKGWKKGFMPGELEPADADHFGSKTLGKSSLEVSSNCDGECTSKDWAAVVDKVYYRQYTSGKVGGTVVKDEKRKLGRTLVFSREPTQQQQGTTTVTSGSKGVTIITTWWADGGSRHYVCTADLGEPIVGMADAFEKACAKIAVAED